MGEGPAEPRAEPRRDARRDTGDSRKGATEPAVRDAQTLLSSAVGRLRTATRAGRAVVWTGRDDGTPYVVAADYTGEPPLTPRAEELTALTELPAATALDRSPRHRRIARRHGLSAAAPIRTGGATAGAVLLIGPEPARPRTLALLDAAASRLLGPLSAALAAARLMRLDEGVLRLDRLAALGRLTAEIAHEVRNPLVSIKTFLQLLPERREDPEFSEQFLAVVNDELRRMERLLDVVVDHAGPARESDEEGGGLASAMQSTVALLRHRAARAAVELETELDAELPAVCMGGDALRQVVLNLAQNAVEATPAGGTVTLRATADAGGVELRVADRGPGIPAPLRRRIFEPFYSTRAEGSGGLGLAITRRLVEEAGGEIGVADRPGGGCEFRIWLASPAGPRSR